MSQRPKAKGVLFRACKHGFQPAPPHLEALAGVGGGQSGVAARGGHQRSRAFGDGFLARVPDAAQLERRAWHTLLAITSYNFNKLAKRNGGSKCVG